MMWLSACKCRAIQARLPRLPYERVLLAAALNWNLWRASRTRVEIYAFSQGWWSFTFCPGLSALRKGSDDSAEVGQPWPSIEGDVFLTQSNQINTAYTSHSYWYRVISFPSHPHGLQFSGVERFQSVRYFKVSTISKNVHLRSHCDPMWHLIS